MLARAFVLLAWALVTGCGARPAPGPASLPEPDSADPGSRPGAPRSVEAAAPAPPQPAVLVPEPTPSTARLLEVPATAVPSPAAPAARPGGLHLFVSNQSFAIPRIDLSVRIDGVVVVDQILETRSQHDWHAFEVALEPGRHVLQARTRAGRAALTKAFSIGHEAWGVLTFWYYPPEHYEPTPRHLAFRLHGQPVLFE